MAAGPRPGPAGRAALAALAACLLVLVVATEGLRCYVCNSKADSRCADPMQAAEEPTEGQDDDDSKSSNSNKNNDNNNNNNNNRDDSQNEGLQTVDCKVAHSVRQAMDAVGGLLSRLGQQSPGGGDVWAAVRASTQASLAAAGATGAAPGQGQQQHGGGLLGLGHQRGGQQGGYDDQESDAACHKVDMEVDGEVVTDRGCAPGRILGEDPCEALAAALGDPESCELCDGDGCNAASTAGASMAAAAAAVVLGRGLPRMLRLQP